MGKRKNRPGKQASPYVVQQNYGYEPGLSPQQQYPPPSQYMPPQHQYGPPQHQYGPPQHQYAPSQPQYFPSQSQYVPPQPQYTPPQPQYTPPQPKYTPPQPKYTPPQPKYAPPVAQNTPQQNQLQMVEANGLEVSIPRGDTVQNPPDGGKRAWLIVLACFIINACNAVIQQIFLMSRSSMEDDLKDAKVEKTIEVYNDLRLVMAPVGAIIAVKFGYRILAIIGGILIAAGFFISSFLDNDNIDAIVFLIAGLGGIGAAFWSLAALVAVLEYFVKKRIRALIASGAGTMVGALIMVGISMIDDIEFLWQDTFKYILVPASIGVAAGGTLVPLKLTMADGSRQSFLGRALGIFDWGLFKQPALYVIMVVYFLESFGRPIPKLKVLQLVGYLDFTEDENLAIILVVVGAPLVGLLTLFFWKNKKLIIVLLWMGPTNVICGIATAVAPKFEAFPLVVSYTAVYGICEGVFSAILNNAVPEAFGYEHIRIVEGLLGLAAGIGAIASGPADENIVEENDWKYSFYLAGGALIASGLCAFIARFALKKST